MHFAWTLGLTNFLPTSGFSIKPLKVKILLAGEQKATDRCEARRVLDAVHRSNGSQWRSDCQLCLDDTGTNTVDERRETSAAGLQIGVPFLNGIAGLWVLKTTCFSI